MLMVKLRKEKIKKVGQKEEIFRWIFTVFFIFNLSFFFSCKPRVKTLPSPPPSLSLEVEEALAIASEQLERGCYVGFRKAFETLRPLVSSAAPWAGLKARILPLYIKSGLLLGLREKEIGLTTSTLNEFDFWPGLQGEWVELRDFYEIARQSPVQAKGIMAYDDRQFETRFKIEDLEKWKKDMERLKEEAERRQDRLEMQACRDEVAAYFWLTAYFNFFPYRESELKPQTLFSLFPKSRLVRFKIAINSSPVPRRDLLEELLEEEPEFYEAHYFLGEEALRRGLLLTAEKHFLEVWKAIPESPIIAISLASVYFHLEEIEKSLEMYEAALELLPGYREAMLGQAICLSYLGRHEEALKKLQTMIDLGYWLLGEAHYWAAWNLYHLNQFQEAWPHCEEAKGRLPTNSQVFSLTGTIALELDRLAQAEENLLKALEFDEANAEALLGLARLEARREKWLEAGDYYFRASLVYESQAQSIRARIKEIESSEMAEERKKAQRRRKEAQLENVILLKATCLYHGATCYFNAGLREKALRLAEEAASHPSLKAKASELMARIKMK